MKTSSKSIKEISYRIFIGLFYLFVFAPVIILIIFSFNNNKYPTLPWSGFTLNWYRGLFSDTTMVEPLTNSLISASLVSLISLAIGFIGANYLFRLKGKSKNVLFGLGFAPALIPPLLLAVKFITYLKFV